MEADVIVIGAGAAGLAAARAVAERSHSAIVLEARDRVGGRVWPLTLGGSSTPADLGAEFIHGRADETRRLLREAGLRAVSTGGEGWTCRNGELERDDDRFFTSAAALLEQAATLKEDESIERFLRRFEANPTLHETIDTARTFVEGFEAADPAIASARAIAAELRSGTDFSSARPVGGYRPMLDRMHDACVAAGVRVERDTRVRAIAWQRDGVTIEVVDPDAAVRELRAKAAIVTLPVGVLRLPPADGGVAFEPELPAAKRAAIAAIEMGHAVKVVLAFRTRFWEELHDGRYRDGAFFRRVGSPFAAYWTQMPVRNHLVVAWAGGPNAVALGDRSEAALIDAACDGFGALFDEPALARRELADGAMHDWARDPFACGAYSYVAAGGEDARAVLAQPLGGVLLFAGEATSTDGQGGTVNGALATGARAAGEVRA